MLDQLRVRYLPAEDRLELRVFVKEPTKTFRLHVTRRLTHLWLQQLASVLEASAGTTPGTPAALRSAVAATNHEALAAKVALSRSGADADTGEAEAMPKLVTRVDCGKVRNQQRWVLRFEFGEGDPLSLTLAPETLHGVIELVVGQLQVADWRLPLPPIRDVPPEGTSRPLH